MKKLILIFAITSIQLTQGSAQVITFQRTYGGPFYDQGNSVQQTSDGGYIVVGSRVRTVIGPIDVHLMKTNAYGDTLWTNNIGGVATGNSVRQTADGGYVITGITTSFGDEYGDAYLTKTDSSGDTLWTRTFGGIAGDAGKSVEQTSDGGYLIVGSTWSFGIGDSDIYLIKTDSLGNAIWTKNFGGTEDEFGWSVQEIDDGGVIVVGETRSFGAGNADVYLIKTNSDGDTSWTKTYGGSDFDYGYCVDVTSDGGYIITGWTQSFAMSAQDVYLIRTDSDGNVLWEITIEEGKSEWGYSVMQTDDGGYIVAGYTTGSGAGLSDVLLVKTDTDGQVLWSQTYGGASSDYGFSVVQTADGGYIVVGYTESFGAGRRDVYLIKTDNLGIVGKAGIDEKYTSPVPNSFSLAPNYPNPFNPATTIEFSMPQRGFVALSIYDILGRKVKTLLNQNMDAGHHKVHWNASTVPSGIYLIRMAAGDFTETRKMILLR